jgi:phage baseplate assembly protein V
MLQVGLITEIDNKKALAKVTADGRVSDWLPVLSMASKKKQSYAPLAVDDQVLVLNPHGNNENGFVLFGVYSKKIKTPEGVDDDTEVTIYEDGTKIIYNQKDKKLEIETKSKIEIKVDNDVNLEAKKVTIKADVKIDGNLEVTKVIKDKKGDLTNHKHSVTEHKLAEPRP